MSSNDHPSPAGSRTLDSLPRFDLTWGYDDPDDPSTVTIHPHPLPESRTEWISVDCEHAIPIDQLE